MEVNKIFALLTLVLLGLAPVKPLITTSTDISQESFRTSSGEIVYASDLAQNVYNNVSKTSYRSLIIEMTSIGPRPYGSENNTKARDWIVSKMADLTENKAEVSIFGNYESIIARLPGTAGEDGPCIMVGGHYDTVATAPGANDDGTGVATALELARILSKRQWPIDIYFVFWNAEELGLWGSYEASQSFAANDTDILVYYNVDMLLVQDPERPTDQRVDMTYYDGLDASFHDAQFWAELTRVMNANFDSPIINPRSHIGFPYWDYSDHRSFQRAGYKSVLFAFETGAHIDHAYHTVNDTWDNPQYDYSIAADTVSSIGASIAFVLSSPLGQQTMELIQKSVSVGSKEQYFIEASMSTELNIHYNWTGSTSPAIEVLDPQGMSLSSKVCQLAGTMGVISINLQDLGMHTITISNMGDSTSNVDLVLSYDLDVDGNEIAESEEPWLSEFLKDSDGDLLSDADERLMGTNKLSNDTDSDGLLDGLEVYVYGTNPILTDSDSDGMPDGFEVEFGLDPTEKDDQLDLDNDELTNVDEYVLGTLVNVSDTDKDGMPDGWEHRMGLDPLHNDALLDSDGDLILNIDEYKLGLHANQWDNVYLFAVMFTTPIILFGILLLLRKRIKA
ncbi:Zn-dependent exopeptidase M28 [Candidatus Thorarchaeota archaeon]|nr:MAG: Zn-dependent exopeptidase M28 [Candidatus Thorarchaeota archaeon]